MSYKFLVRITDGRTTKAVVIKDFDNALSDVYGYSGFDVTLEYVKSNSKGFDSETRSYIVDNVYDFISDAKTKYNHVYTKIVKII